MKTILKMREFFWPILGPFSESQDLKHRELLKSYGDANAVLDNIKYIKDEGYAEKVANTAQVLFEDEENRLKTVESKSVTLLSATGLIITLIVNFSQQILTTSSNVTNTFIWWIILFCFLVTLVYFFRSVMYSLKCVFRKGYHKLDVKDIVDSTLQQKIDYFKRIVSVSISNRVKNYKVINEKVDHMVMSHLFFKRGMIAFMLTALLYIGSRLNFKFLVPNIKDIIYLSLLIVVVVLVIVDLIITYQFKKNLKN